MSAAGELARNDVGGCAGISVGPADACCRYSNIVARRTITHVEPPRAGSTGLDYRRSLLVGFASLRQASPGEY